MRGMLSNFESDDLVLLGIAGIALYVLAKGGIGNAAAGAGAAVVNAAADAIGGATTGAVGAVGAQVGLPTPDQTTTDPRVSRYIIDHPGGGYFAASKWSSATALAQAMMLPEFGGYEPPHGSSIALAFPSDVYFSGGATGGW